MLGDDCAFQLQSILNFFNLLHRSDASLCQLQGGSPARFSPFCKPLTDNEVDSAREGGFDPQVPGEDFGVSINRVSQPLDLA